MSSDWEKLRLESDIKNCFWNICNCENQLKDCQQEYDFYYLRYVQSNDYDERFNLRLYRLNDLEQKLNNLKSDLDALKKEYQRRQDRLKDFLAKQNTPQKTPASSPVPGYPESIPQGGSFKEWLFEHFIIGLVIVMFLNSIRIFRHIRIFYLYSTSYFAAVLIAVGFLIAGCIRLEELRENCSRYFTLLDRKKGRGQEIFSVSMLLVAILYIVVTLNQYERGMKLFELLDSGLLRTYSFLTPYIILWIVNRVRLIYNAVRYGKSFLIKKVAQFAIFMLIYSVIIVCISIFFKGQTWVILNLEELLHIPGYLISKLMCFYL